MASHSVINSVFFFFFLNVWNESTNFILREGWLFHLLKLTFVVHLYLYITPIIVTLLLTHVNIVFHYTSVHLSIRFIRSF